MHILKIWIMVFFMLIQQLSAQTYTDYNFNFNKITSHLGYFPKIQGKGMILSIKDANIDTSLLDLVSKKFYFDFESNAEVSSHASKMALLTTSRGYFSSFFKGVAPSADLHISLSERLLPNFQNLLQSGAKIQLHPYGTNIENYYGLDASAYDAMMESDTSFLHVFSAGNSGTQIAIGGIYDGLIGWSNMTGNFKQSKNSLAVGALNEHQNVLEISSCGPSFDGRVKPEIVAYGEKGTSDAAAIVAGGLLLLQELYKKKYDIFPSSALLKSAIIASANPVNGKLLSFKTGYGNFDHLEAMRLIDTEQYFYGEIQANEVKEYSIFIPDSTENIRLALTWIDPHASVNTSNVLINDLDFKVIDENGNVILPLVLNNTKNQSTLNNDPENGFDHINNVEFICIKNPVQGNIRLIVGSTSLKTSSQKYYIAYSLKQTGKFELVNAKDSILYSENMMRLSWATAYRRFDEFGYIDSIGEKYKIDKVDISPYSLTFPFNYSGKAKFYVKISDKEFISKEYLLIGLPIISQVIKTNGLLIVKYANYLPTSVDAYYLDGKRKVLANNNLTKYNSYILFPTIYNTYWLRYKYSQYSIESIPIRVDTVSTSSLIENYYIQNDEKIIRISINILMSDLIDSILLKKKIFAKNIKVDSISVKSGLIILKDRTPLKGLNNYYLEIKTKIRDKLLIEDLKYFYIPDNPVIYPNPISKHECINIKFREPSLRKIQVMTIDGKILAQFIVESTENRLCFPYRTGQTLILRVQSEAESYSTIVTLK